MPRSLAPQLAAALPSAHLARLRRLAGVAATHNLALYVVGGFVRDLLLNRPSLDFDLVVESDALTFAQQVLDELGGQLVTHAKFHTATWAPPDEPGAGIDLISARRETYAHPAALPEVTLSTLPDDIRRRDFTINTFAIRLDGDHYGELLDLLHSEQDLKDGLIRVLHPASFIDDPTRLFRAVRYEQRYNFQIAPDTLALIPAALPFIASLSGDRIRHELERILDEKDSLLCIRRLAQLGILTQIHPALTAPQKEYALKTFDELLADIEPEATTAIIDRLKLPRADVVRLEQSRAGRNLIQSLQNQTVSLSSLHAQAKDLPLRALNVAQMIERPAKEVAGLIQTYLTRRAALHPHTNGQTILALGLPPGPRYKEILFKLECAYLDGEITSAAEEHALLEKLVAEAR